MILLRKQRADIRHKSDEIQTGADIIAEATRNRFFVSVMTSLRDHIVFGMNLSRDLSRMQPTARLKAVRDEHRKVFDAIRARDPDRAHEAMRIHVERARFRIFEGGTKSVASAIGPQQPVPHGAAKYQSC
jgi:hypothetical protein